MKGHVPANKQSWFTYKEACKEMKKFPEIKTVSQFVKERRKKKVEYGLYN